MTVTGDRGDKPYDCPSLPRSERPGYSRGKEDASRGWEDAQVEEMELKDQSRRADSSCQSCRAGHHARQEVAAQKGAA